MNIGTLIQFGIGIGLAIIGWLLKACYDSFVKAIDNKMDKGCHDICSDNRDKMYNMLLDELRGMRDEQKGLRSDFKTKSEIVVSAVTGTPKKGRKKK